MAEKGVLSSASRFHLSETAFFPGLASGGLRPDDGRSGATHTCLPVTPLGRTQEKQSAENATRPQQGEERRETRSQKVEV